MNPRNQSTEFNPVSRSERRRQDVRRHRAIVGGLAATVAAASYLSVHEVSSNISANPNSAETAQILHNMETGKVPAEVLNGKVSFNEGVNLRTSPNYIVADATDGDQGDNVAYSVPSGKTLVVSQPFIDVLPNIEGDVSTWYGFQFNKETVWVDGTLLAQQEYGTPGANFYDVQLNVSDPNFDFSYPDASATEQAAWDEKTKDFVVNGQEVAVSELLSNEG